MRWRRKRVIAGHESERTPRAEDALVGQLPQQSLAVDVRQGIGSRLRPAEGQVGDGPLSTSDGQHPRGVYGVMERDRTRQGPVKVPRGVPHRAAYHAITVAAMWSPRRAAARRPASHRSCATASSSHPASTVISIVNGTSVASSSPSGSRSTRAAMARRRTRATGSLRRRRQRPARRRADVLLAHGHGRSSREALPGVGQPPASARGERARSPVRPEKDKGCGVRGPRAHCRESVPEPDPRGLRHPRGRDARGRHI